MRVFTLLDRAATIVGRVEQLRPDSRRRHGVLGAVARRRDQPADRQRLRTLGTNLDRHLIGRTTDTALRTSMPGFTLLSAS